MGGIGRVLDVGCGLGGLGVALSERGWQVTGIDIARNAIAAAQHIAEARGAAVTFVAADATTWKPDGRYDLVTCHFGLPSSPSDRQAIYRMVRTALAPGGAVLMKFCEGNVSGLPALSGYDALSVGELSIAFSGFAIATPEYVRIPSHMPRGHRGGDEYWTAVLFEARKPR
jgi:SAM-dependent methyltransferase